jgi:hypothetical protein
MHQPIHACTTWIFETEAEVLDEEFGPNQHGHEVADGCIEAATLTWSQSGACRTTLARTFWLLTSTIQWVGLVLCSWYFGMGFDLRM